MTKEEIKDNWYWLCASGQPSLLKQYMEFLVSYCTYYKVSADWLLGIIDEKVG